MDIQKSKFKYLRLQQNYILRQVEFRDNKKIFGTLWILDA